MRWWARGYPKESHNAVEATLGVVVCLLHGPMATIDQFLSPRARATLGDLQSRMGYAPPDWETAELVLRPLDAFEAIQAFGQ
jgi:hypothetical protein